MKIIITGAGDVGYHLAKMLSSELQDIYVIDEDEDRLNYVQSHIDIFPILGDATSFDVLAEAQVKVCDLLIAVTSSEETNLLVSIMAKKYGAKKTIARVSNLENLLPERKKMFKDLGVDTIISPDILAAEEIERLIKKSAFTDNIEFEGGKLTVFGIAIGNKSALRDKTVGESSYLNPNLSFKPIAIHRNESTIIVNGDTEILENDIVYFISTPESIDKITEFCDQQCFEIKNIMILGGNRVGELAARLFQDNYKVVIVDGDEKNCERLASNLSNTLILNIDGRDVETMKEEGLGDMDAFISVTLNSETNIISSLVAKNHGVRKTIARVENIDYIHLSQNIGVDTLINKKVIAASNIFKHIRKGNVDAIANLNGVDAEIIEFTVKPNSKVTRKRIKDLKFPKTANISGVIRGEESLIPFGSFQLEEGDKAVVFSLTESINQIERYFQ
ncbi:Trk system potassium transporter TrkA [Flavobacteriales bacterium]|nr:Trk system potassium transporter TrkA [Flavobacteriales bacterium]